MHPFPRPGGAHETVITEVIAHDTPCCASAPPGRRRGANSIPGFRPPEADSTRGYSRVPLRGNESIQVCPPVQPGN